MFYVAFASDGHPVAIGKSREIAKNLGEDAEPGTSITIRAADALSSEERQNVVTRLKKVAEKVYTEFLQIEKRA